MSFTEGVQCLAGLQAQCGHEGWSLSMCDVGTGVRQLRGQH